LSSRRGPGSAPAPLCLVGVGSHLGGDQVAWEVVRRVARRLQGTGGRGEEVAPDRIDCECTARVVGPLLERLRGRRVALVLDAARSGLAPGTLLELAAADGPGGAADTLGHHSSHGPGVMETLALGRALGMLPPRLRLLGVEIGDGLQLPPAAVLDALAGAVLRIAKAELAALEDRDNPHEI